MTPEQTPVLEASRQKNRIAEEIKQYKQSETFTTKRPNSQISYSIDIKQFEKFCQTQGISTLVELKPQDITNWANSMKNGQSAEATVARRIAGVKSFLTWAIAEGLLKTDFKPDLPQFKSERPVPKILTPEQTRNLINETLQNKDKRDATLVQILLKTGAKTSEIVELKTEDILNVSGQTAVRLATGQMNERTILLDEETEKIIREYFDQRKPKQREAGQPLFTNQRWIQKEPLTRQGIWLILKKYGERIQVSSLNTSTLRYTFAANLSGTQSERARILGVSEHTAIFTDQLIAKALGKVLRPQFKSVF